MSGIEARDIIEAELRRELFGPLESDQPVGKPIDCSSGSIRFETIEDSRGRFYDSATMQEILNTGSPLSRYGVGVLHGGSTASRREMEVGDVDLIGVPGIPHNEEAPDEPPIEIRGTLRHDTGDADDFDLNSANSFKPSAMAISFQCRIPTSGSLAIRITGAHYEKIKAHIPGHSKPVDWWCRRPFTLNGSLRGSSLVSQTSQLTTVDTITEGTQPVIAPTTQVFARPVPGGENSTLRLVTVAIVNQTLGKGPDSALFQMGFTVTATDGLTIEPYPEAERRGRDDEEQSIDLL